MKYQKWTNHEIARLRRCYALMTREELAIAFAPHGIRSIETVASLNGIRKRRDWMAIAKAHVFTFEMGAGE